MYELRDAVRHADTNPFTEGATVLFIRRYADPCDFTERVIRKVYKDGDFVLVGDDRNTRYRPACVTYASPRRWLAQCQTQAYPDSIYSDNPDERRRFQQQVDARAHQKRTADLVSKLSRMAGQVTPEIADELEAILSKIVE